MTKAQRLEALHSLFRSVKGKRVTYDIENLAELGTETKTLAEATEIMRVLVLRCHSQMCKPSLQLGGYDIQELHEKGMDIICQYFIK